MRSPNTNGRHPGVVPGSAVAAFWRHPNRHVNPLSCYTARRIFSGLSIRGSFKRRWIDTACPVTAGEPGKTIPPTVCTLAILASLGAPCQRSIHKVSARRTRGSSNGFLLWLGSMIPPQFQSLSCAVILSPSAPTSSSLTAGGSPRNSIAARSLRIASTRTACLST